MARSNSAAPSSYHNNYTRGDSVGIGPDENGPRRNGKKGDRMGVTGADLVDLEALLMLRSEVAYRLPKQKGAEGEWIQCIVVDIMGEGVKRRLVPP